MAAINKINATINFDLLKDEYTITKYTSHDSFIKKSNRNLNKKYIEAKAIYFSYGKSFYALFDKDKSVEIEGFSKENLAINTIDISILVSLLLEVSLSKEYIEISGSIFKIIKRYDNKLIALNFKINDLILEVNQTSFILVNANTEGALFFEKENKYYIRNGHIDKKDILPFFSKDNLNKMEEMKKIIANFNSFYTNKAKLELNNYEAFYSCDLAKIMDYKLDIQKIYQERPLFMINQISSVKGKERFEEIRKALENYLKVSINVANIPSEQALNLIYLHNKSFYSINKIPDNYKKLLYKAPIQGFTIENDNYFLTKNKEINKALITTLKELIIKYDLLVKHEISLNRPIGYEYTFVMESNNNYYEMNLNKNGSFKIKRIEDDIFNQEELNLYRNCLNNSKLKKILIKDNYGNINTINQTNLVYLDLISSGINFYNVDENLYYAVSLGLENNIKATHLYKIELVRGNKNLLLDIVSLLGSRVISDENIMVYPYPIKYLREFIALENDK